MHAAVGPALPLKVPEITISRAFPSDTRWAFQRLRIIVADFWRSFRRQLVWLDWQIWMLAHLGLLNCENTASRWLKRQLSQLEHGLRCMLVIGCQNRATASPAKAGAQLKL